MVLLADSRTPYGEEAYRKFREKLEKRGVSTADLRDGFAFFARSCNQIDPIRYEMREKNQIFQFNLKEQAGIKAEAAADDESYTIAFENGTCASYEGAPETPTVIFFIGKDTAAAIINGSVYSLVAQMGGYVKYTGPKPQALIFQRIFELFLDQFHARNVEDLKSAAAKIKHPAGVVKFGLLGGGQAFHFHSNGDRFRPASRIQPSTTGTTRTPRRWP
jgi:hypothetical protein